MKLWRIITASMTALSLAMLPQIEVARAGAGYYTATLPIIGGSSFCGSYVTGTGNLSGATGAGQGTIGYICGQTIPAGPPALVGSELIPVDIGAISIIGAQTVSPTSAALPVSLLGTAVNRLIGGDATTNLNQRSATTKGVTALATLSPTAAVITADRWWAVAPAAGLTYTVDATASSATVPGLNNTKAFRLARTSSGAAGVACFGQTLDQAAAAPLIGNNAVFSFYEKNGSTMSATNGQIVVNIDYTTVADAAAGQSTLGFAGTNGKLFAQLDVGGTITGLTNATQGVTGLSNGTTGTLTAGLTNGFSATIPASTTWTRYSVFATIPATLTSSLTPVTEVSVSVCFTPTATTAVATDYIELEGLQLEAKPSTVSPNLPNGVTSPSAFARRDPAIEQTLQYYYWYFNYEQQSLGLTVNGSCASVTTSLSNCVVTFPVPMRIVPALKFTDGFQLFTQVAQTSLTAGTSLGLSTSLASFASNTGFLMTMSGTVAVGANEWMSLGTSGGSGIIAASAEP